MILLGLGELFSSFLEIALGEPADVVNLQGCVCWRLRRWCC